MKSRYHPGIRASCFTHVDPFEDTESDDAPDFFRRALDVSPTSIRSRILKGGYGYTYTYTYTWFHPRRSVRGY